MGTDSTGHRKDFRFWSSELGTVLWLLECSRRVTTSDLHFKSHSAAV